MRVLVIQFGRLGDLAQTLPVLRRMRDAMPDIHLSVLCVREFAPLLDLSGLADRIIDLPASRLVPLLHAFEAQGSSEPLLDQIHPALTEPYDKLVNLSYGVGAGVLCSRIDTTEKWGRLEAPREVIRVAGDWGKYLFATADARRYNLFNYVDACIGLAGLPHSPVPPCLPVSDAQRNFWRRKLTGNARGPVVGFQLGANKAYRAWPADSFAALAQLLVETEGAIVVLLGGAGEKPLARAVMEQSGAVVVDLVGRTGLKELPSVLAACDVVVSNDTGPLHAAAAVGTPVLGLYFAAACFTETAPYGEGHVVLQVELPCSPCHDDQVCPAVLCRRILPPEAVASVVSMMLRGDRLPKNFPSVPVEIYRSGFAADGTVLYRPVKPPASTLYKTALASRLMWAAIFDLASDPAIECDLSAQLSPCRRALDGLASQYRQAAAAALKMAATLVDSRPDTNLLRGQAAALDAVEARLVAMPAPMKVFQDFHRLVLMEMQAPPDADGLTERRAGPGDSAVLAAGYQRLAMVADKAWMAIEAAVQHEKRHPIAVRHPKVLVVGAVAGGTVPIGQAAFKALKRIGIPVQLLDFSDWQNDLARVKQSANVLARQDFLTNCQMRLTKAVLAFRPDIVLAMAQSPLGNPGILQWLRARGIGLCYWFLEDYRVFDYWRRIGPFFDHFFIIQQNPFPEKLAEAGCRQVHYLPAAFDANVRGVPAGGPALDISFMGAPYPNRVHHFGRLKHPGLAIFGEGWDRKKNPAVVCGQRRIGPDEARGIYLRTRVNLNLHSASDPESFGAGDFVNPRTFELAGLGAFQLTDRRTLLPLHFDPQDEIQVCDDWETMARAIDYYLTHEGERRRIARRAQRRVLREHTYENRMERLLAIATL